MEKTAKILLVDDDVDFVESTKTVLESKPYEVIVACNGEEGLRKVKDEKPDLVVLDIIMPAEDGFTVAERLKSDPELAEIPIIMLTSYSAKGAGTGIPLSQGYELEANDYIEKPITPQDLLAAVANQLKK